MGDGNHDSSLPLDILKTRSGLALRAIYTELFDVAPPRRASDAFLRGNMAWAIQAKELKKDPFALRSALIAATNRPVSPQHTVCRAGTRLIREWHGTIHEVMVLDKGYFWNGKTYRSLTRITREITGTNWSGPRFFGLRSKRP